MAGAVGFVWRDDPRTLRSAIIRGAETNGLVAARSVVGRDWLIFCVEKVEPRITSGDRRGPEGTRLHREYRGTPTEGSSVRPSRSERLTRLREGRRSAQSTPSSYSHLLLAGRLGYNRTNPRPYRQPARRKDAPAGQRPAPEQPVFPIDLAARSACDRRSISTAKTCCYKFRTHSGPMAPIGYRASNH